MKVTKNLQIGKLIFKEHPLLQNMVNFFKLEKIPVNLIIALIINFMIQGL